jgi:hypothetical protein
MSDDLNRTAIIILALLGLILSIMRVRPYITFPEREPEPPRAELARDMQLYELSIFQGSSYSYLAYGSVQSICRDDGDDSVIVNACSIFEEALHHQSNHTEIDQAIDLLKGES